MRRAALRAMGYIYRETANKDARRLIKLFLRDVDPGVRLTAAKVIFKIFKNTNNDDLIRETLSPLLEDDIWYVRSTVKDIFKHMSGLNQI
ncbi:MAG: hypothetical protein B6U95_08170 [Thermofilum sp. ex4484_82]|nr:MAG: hypothetical protein B6U95_08170 [Thermofilum sp. ex4484_82]OYT36593.1 MAG: hypothetical protein B6U96_08170 [Archaeoglobales archaeon ex4484_92]